MKKPVDPKTQPMALESSYLEMCYNLTKYKKLVTRVSKKIKSLHKKLKFTHIAFTGSSGAAIAYPVSIRTGIKLMHIRKAAENSHGNSIEGVGLCKSYIILDDFISTGTTIRRIKKAVAARCTHSKTPKCVGIALYEFGACDMWDMWDIGHTKEWEGTPVFNV